MRNHIIVLGVVAILALATLDATPLEDRRGKIFICKGTLSKVNTILKFIRPILLQQSILISECFADIHCQNTEACSKYIGKCVDPCEPLTCDEGTSCYVSNHTPSCEGR